MKKLVLASNNPGKIRELRDLLAPLDIDVIPQADLAIPEAEEPHGTFIENALAKARHAAAAERPAGAGGRLRYLRRCAGRRAGRPFRALCR